ncbi:MAG TPA: flagellar hook-basal body complex protein [Ideonella sp.]|uniref:flagellar hook protein FlgE n=1 Tax=Ideonella sp. TaxID=1929293 RepID=UPI002E31FC98|nr:flagellar hook-basal body complex protein [Ideonella sp.]HEX5682657.1 flagellar hook-basal body complex protein [Ideonella sp.]
MLDSIFIGMSGLMGYSRGLRVIANNTANINTPGFKGAALQFGDLFYASGPASGTFSGAGVNQLGQGLGTYSTTLDFSQGELRQSGNAMDLAVDGQGLFTLKDKNGELRYTRDGEFKFDDDGFLVSRSTGAKVMARDDSGALVDVSLENLRTNNAEASSTVKFSGQLASHETTDTHVRDGSHTLSEVVIYDAMGAKHTLRLEFKEAANSTPLETRWDVTVKEGTATLSTGSLRFVNQDIDASTAKITFDYKQGQQITLDFSANVKTVSSGNLTTLAVSSIDGHDFGNLTEASFDADGILNLKYSNGQTTKGVRLTLSRFTSTDNVRAAGDNMFEPVDSSSWEIGAAQTGAFGAIRSGVVEISNVDLSSEFSDLVIMQRGYQASSQVVSTANEMIQELFSLKGR